MPRSPRSRRAQARQVDDNRRRRDRYNAAGLALHAEGRHDEAIEAFRAGFRLDTTDARFLVNAGAVLLQLGRLDEAEACLVGAIGIDPGRYEAHDNLGVLFKERGDFAHAIECHREALRLRHPDVPPKTLANLAAAHECHGDAEEALDLFDEIARQFPANFEARLGRGLARLSLGDMGGMIDLDARLEREGHRANMVPDVPLWDGSYLGGKTLLVNQFLDGFGDAIHGIRSAAAARRRCGRLVVSCSPAIGRLLGRAEGVDAVITGPGELPAILPDVAAQCPPLGLPWYCGLSAVDEIPGLSPVPYLSAEPERYAYWRDTLRYPACVRVGVAWQGSPTHALDAFRSFPLAELAPLAKVRGVQLFGLQKGFGTDQIPDAPFRLTDLNHWDEYRDGDFLETAAVIQALDLVITPDTAIAHLAGALGKPVWLAIPQPAEWRWLREGDRTPWYPTARPFRQPTPGDWIGVFATMADELRNMVG